MPRFIPQRQEQILAAMLPRAVVQGGFTDITDSSGVLSLLTAVAFGLDQANYQMFLLLSAFSLDTAEGADLDARAADIGSPGLTRRQAVAATGTVVFSRAQGTGTINIPAGTQVLTSDGSQTYRTTLVGQITDTTAPSIVGHAAGQDSVPVPIVAVSSGATGNVASGTLTSFGSRPSGVDTVTNLAATTGGQDIETDDAYRARIQNYIAGLPRATSGSIVGAVLGQTDPVSGRTITFASIVEDPQNPGVVTLLIDDGTGNATTTQAVTGELLTRGLTGSPPNTAVGGERRFFLLQAPVHPDQGVVLVSNLRGRLVQDVDFRVTYSTGQIMMAAGLTAGETLTCDYTYYTGIVALAQSIVNGTPTQPGYRAAGVVVNVRTPQTVTTAVAAALTVLNGYDPETVDEAVASAFTTYVNTLGIGEDILRASLIQAAMNVPGVSNVSLATPLADVAVLDDQIARIAASNVTVN